MYVVWWVAIQKVKSVFKTRISINSCFYFLVLFNFLETIFRMYTFIFVSRRVGRTTFDRRTAQQNSCWDKIDGSNLDEDLTTSDCLHERWLFSGDFHGKLISYAQEVAKKYSRLKNIQMMRENEAEKEFNWIKRYSGCNFKPWGGECLKK